MSVDDAAVMFCLPVKMSVIKVNVFSFDCMQDL